MPTSQRLWSALRTSLVKQETLRPSTWLAASCQSQTSWSHWASRLTHTCCSTIMPTTWRGHATFTVECSIVASRLDYFNSLLYGAPLRRWSYNECRTILRESSASAAAIRCQTTSTLATLAASEASHQIEDGGFHSQGSSDINTGISERADKHHTACVTPAVVPCTSAHGA